MERADKWHYSLPSSHLSLVQLVNPVIRRAIVKKPMKNCSITVIVVLLVLLLGAGAFVYSGAYNIGADDPHTRPVLVLMQTLRNRSIRVRSGDIQVPNLDDPQMILNGAGHYAAMCTGCHLRPGMKNSEIRPGLYPQPPALAEVHVDPRDAFWVIKHGIKMSAMPAWGGSHDDPTIWSMVAFVEKLPGMTPEQYQEIVAKAPPDDDMDMGEDHTHHHHDTDANGKPQPQSATAQPDADHPHVDHHENTQPAPTDGGQE